MQLQRLMEWLNRQKEIQNAKELLKSAYEYLNEASMPKDKLSSSATSFAAETRNYILNR